MCPSKPLRLVARATAADDDRHAPLNPNLKSDYSPAVHAASDEAKRQLATFKIPPGLKVKLWAAEPMLANPVCLTVDEHGRIFVGETYRIHKGVDDDRGHMNWLDDDMASATVADRLALYRKHLSADQFKEYAAQRERIRLLEDRSGGGVADRATTFCDDFHDQLDGIGAGLLARRRRFVLHLHPKSVAAARYEGERVTPTIANRCNTGYGVRVSFLGHDLHGLKIGPDGKLYLSIGDRGFNVLTHDGRVVADMHSGAVLRCNLDGSELEVFATGLRNPQRLAFDEYGNLFTGDNNSDSGDRARWVYVVEGGDSGWRMPYQYLSDRGPFNREHLWDPPFAGQAAYIVPPIGWIADGPAGVVYYPGTGWSDEWQGRFFLCDFRGAAGPSGVRSLAMKPKGASFEITDAKEFFWHVLATDLEWGPDGSLFVADWVEGWDGPGKGRVHRVFDPQHEHDPIVSEVKQLIGEGMTGRTVPALIKLLGHADMRVRQEAQFALADQGAAVIGVLAKLAATPPKQVGDATTLAKSTQLSRIHAMWALGQIAARQERAKEPLTATASLRSLTTDPDPEIRAQAARVLGDARDPEALGALVELLKDKSLRVRHLAAIALGRIRRIEAVPAILELLRANDDQDAVLRHSGVMALDGSAGRTWNGLAALVKAMSDKSPAVRLGVLLVLRREGQPMIAEFLKDADPRLVVEAARAINDVPLEQSFAQLAALIDLPPAGSELDRDALMRRVLNANFRLGTPETAAALARYAAKADAPDAMRIEALRMLGDWAKPSPHDRVTNFWRPMSPRPENIAADALRPALLGVFISASENVRIAAIEIAGRLGLKEIAPELVKMVGDPSRPASNRAQAPRIARAV